MSLRERLEQRMEELGLSAKRSLGQNFLVSDLVIEKILKAAGAETAHSTIEIGPGLGALTEGLIAQGRPLLLIELDRKIAEYWRERNVEVIEEDALRTDWESLAARAPSTLLVSNLPYQISSSLVIDRCLGPDGIVAMIFMFQKEVAQRLRARKGTKEYSLLSVMAQAFWSMETVSDAGPKDFKPAPRVASRVLKFKRLESPLPATDRERFLSYLKNAFAQRRKFLKKNLLSLGHSSEQIDTALKSVDLKDTVRAEELDPAQHLQLFHALGRT